MEDFRERSSLDTPAISDKPLYDVDMHISGGQIQSNKFGDHVGGAITDTLVSVITSMLKDDVPTTFKDVAYKLGHSFLQRMCYGNKKKSASNFSWDRTSYGSFFDPFDDDDWFSSGSNIKRSSNNTQQTDARYDSVMPDVWFYTSADADKAIRIMQNLIADPAGPGYISVGNMYDLMSDPNNPETRYKTTPTQFEWGWASLKTASVSYSAKRDRKHLPAYKLEMPPIRQIAQLKRERREND